MRISHSFYFLVGIVVATGFVSADPPKKPRASQYTRLWTNSPFTIKPEAAAVAKESPLERDWMVGSIRPNGDGYSVTLINKKDRKDRLRFLPGFPVSGYELMDVQQDTKNNENSRVQIKKGSQVAWISYDTNLIKVRSSAGGGAKKPAPNRTAKTSSASKTKRVVPPIPNKSKATQGSNSIPRPRVRSVPRR